MRRIRNEAGAVAMAVPIHISAAGRVASALSPASSWPTSALTLIRITLLVVDNAKQPDSNRTLRRVPPSAAGLTPIAPCVR